MDTLPKIVKQGWEDREGPIVFSTVSKKGIPNSIYASCAKMLDGGSVVVADNYFDKTRSNIKEGSVGSILFISKENKAFQIKGKIEYHTDDDIHAEMKSWVDSKLPAIAAAVVQCESIYSGSEKLL